MVERLIADLERLAGDTTDDLDDLRTTDPPCWTRACGLLANRADLWIAAVAQASSMDVVTQDQDFDVIEAAGGPRVVRV